MKAAIFLICFFVLGSIVSALNPFLSTETPEIEEETSYGQHVELGDVHWYRNFSTGKSIANESGKPMFVLFQEIPGCKTCQDYGNQPLSHPLVVEAIEDLFVPVAVFNNKEGEDARILKRFSEKSWNNPVVRYLDNNENDIIDRRDGIWGISGTVQRMVGALKSSGKQVPTYLYLIRPLSNAKLETAEFAMHCFWEGEWKLGSIDGVHSTRAGWRDGVEVVQVKYSPATVDYKNLLTAAQSFDCASKVFAHTDAQLETARSVVGDKALKASGKMRDADKSDQKYYLSRTIFRHLPLTQMQATKVNSLVKQRKPVDKALSPRQRQLARKIQAVTDADKDALRGFVFPQNESQLSTYQKKLSDRLLTLSPTQ